MALFLVVCVKFRDYRHAIIQQKYKSDIPEKAINQLNTFNYVKHLYKWRYISHL